MRCSSFWSSYHRTRAKLQKFAPDYPEGTGPLCQYKTYKPPSWSSWHYRKKQFILDFIIVRENTEGLYSGIEGIGPEISWTKRIVTRRGSERIAEYACKLAKQRKNKLTIVHKSNVLKSDNLFLDVCRRTASDHAVEYGDMLVDSMAYSLIMHPEI